MASVQKQTATQKYVVLARLNNATTGMVQFVEPAKVGTEPAVKMHWSPSSANQNSPIATFLKSQPVNTLVILECAITNHNLSVHQVHSFDPAEMFGVYVDNLGQADTGKIFEAVKDFSDSYGFKIKEEGKLSDRITMAKATSSPGLTIAKNVNRVEALRIRNSIVGNNVPAKIELSDDPKFKTFQTITDLIDGAEKVVKTVNSIKKIGNYQVPEIARPIIPICKDVLELGEHFAIMTTGPSGSGKTQFFTALAKHLECDIYIVKCQVVNEPTKWFGKLQLRDGSTVFEKSPFAKILERGNAVIVFDEINRVLPQDSNALLSLLDDQRAITLEDVDVEIKVGNGIIFGATQNVGDSFTGTVWLDEALANRFQANIPFTALTRQQEFDILTDIYGKLEKNKINSLLNSIDEVRKCVNKFEISIDVSVRPLLSCGSMVQKGMSIKNAILYTIVNRVKDAGHQKSLIEIANRITD